MEWVIGFIVLVIIGAITKQNETKNLKRIYDETLNGVDKRAALNAGRAYYQNIRKGALTVYDEQAITNDISTMK